MSMVKHKQTAHDDYNEPCQGTSTPRITQKKEQWTLISIVVLVADELTDIERHI